MAMISSMLVLLVVLGLVSTFIIVVLRKGVSGLKLMLLGINITLFGGILAVDPNSNLGGFDYLIVLIGLIFSIIGFGKKIKTYLKIRYLNNRRLSRRKQRKWLL